MKAAATTISTVSRSRLFRSHTLARGCRAGMDTFLQLYDAPNTEEAIATLYDASREELVRRAGM